MDKDDVPRAEADRGVRACKTFPLLAGSDGGTSVHGKGKRETLGVAEQ